RQRQPRATPFVRRCWIPVLNRTRTRMSCSGSSAPGRKALTELEVPAVGHVHHDHDEYRVPEADKRSHSRPADQSANRCTQNGLKNDCVNFESAYLSGVREKIQAEDNRPEGRLKEQILQRESTPTAVWFVTHPAGP